MHLLWMDSTELRTTETGVLFPPKPSAVNQSRATPHTVDQAGPAPRIAQDLVAARSLVCRGTDMIRLLRDALSAYRTSPTSRALLRDKVQQLG